LAEAFCYSDGLPVDVIDDAARLIDRAVQV
jgi:hypothetical protein